MYRRRRRRRKKILCTFKELARAKHRKRGERKRRRRIISIRKEGRERTSERRKIISRETWRNHVLPLGWEAMAFLSRWRIQRAVIISNNSRLLFPFLSLLCFFFFFFFVIAIIGIYECLVCVCLCISISLVASERRSIFKLVFILKIKIKYMGT